MEKKKLKAVGIGKKVGRQWEMKKLGNPFLQRDILCIQRFNFLQTKMPLQRRRATE
jgi:hypothetical protein